MTTSPLLQINDLRVRYKTDRGTVSAVNGVTFAINKGEALAIVGESGCGKSTLAMVILSLLDRKQAFVQGEILFDDEDLLSMSRQRLQSIRGRRIAMAFQDPMSSLNPYLRIGTQVSEQIRRHLDMTNQQVVRHTTAMLAAVGIPDPDKRGLDYPHEFSGGMRQRALMAAALSCAPDLLIADEPTTALDVTIQQQILNLIQSELSKREMSLLLISHDLSVVAGLCRRVLVMYAGEIVEDGDITDIYANPCHPYTRSLLTTIPRLDRDRTKDLPTIPGQPPNMTSLDDQSCSFSPRCQLAVSKCMNSKPDLTVDSRGRIHRCFFELPDRPPDSEDNHACSSIAGKTVARTVNDSPAGDADETILTVENLTVRYDHGKRNLFGISAPGFAAVSDVSFTVRRGEIVGLVGESGCGKSTLVRSILRLIDSTQGRVIFGGRDVLALGGTELRRIRRNMQLVFQDPYSSLNPQLTAWRNIAEPIINYKIAHGKNAVTEAKRLMEMVGIDPGWAYRYPHEFSGGQRQRLGIARALALEPSMIFCDEPVSSLDVSIQAQILNLIKELQQKLTLSLLFISHDLGVVRLLSNRIMVMYSGRIVEISKTDVLFQKPRHPYTQALIRAVPIPDPEHRQEHACQLSKDSTVDAKANGNGCDFFDRCPWADGHCQAEKPDLEGGDVEHQVACFHWKDHQHEW